MAPPRLPLAAAAASSARAPPAAPATAAAARSSSSSSGSSGAALSKVVLEKLLRAELPEDVAVQKETLEWLGDCAAELVRLAGSEANAIAASTAKKENYRVSGDHVLQALENLGKPAYAELARERLGARTEQTQQRRKEKRERVGSKSGASATESHEELLAAQNALFKQASLRATKEGW